LLKLAPTPVARFCSRIGQKQSKLVSVKSSNKIDLAQSISHNASHLFQNLSAALNLELYFELEVIEIDVCNSEGTKAPA